MCSRPPGVLVTTSWVAKASRDFAARNGSRIELIEGRHLKSLLREHLGLDVLISLPPKFMPEPWIRHSIRPLAFRPVTTAAAALGLANT
jgi:restriction system protein